MIVVWNEHSAFVSGEVLKSVRCEKCSAEYVYRLSRTASGETKSLFFLNERGAREDAESRAQNKLKKELAAGCDPVACPLCGWYQLDMVEEARRRFRPVVLYSGIGVAGAGLLTLIYMFGQSIILERNIGQFGWYAGFGLLVAGVGSLVVRKVQRDSYDPNFAGPGARRRSGHQYGLSREEFERKAAEQPELDLTQLFPPTPMDRRQGLIRAVVIALTMSLVGGAASTYLLWNVIANPDHLPMFAKRGPDLGSLMAFAVPCLIFTGAGVWFLFFGPCREPNQSRPLGR